MVRASRFELETYGLEGRYMLFQNQQVALFINDL
jgi:hypothetical protein